MVVRKMDTQMKHLLSRDLEAKNKTIAKRINKRRREEAVT